MSDDRIEPFHLAVDEFAENRSSIDLQKGWSLFIVMFLSALPDRDFQVLIDAGESGRSRNRLQCFLDADRSLNLRLSHDGGECTAKIDGEHQAVYLDRWFTLALFAGRQDDGLRLRLSINNAFDEEVICPDGGADLIGDRFRIGNALSGGRGIEMGFLSLLSFSEVTDHEKTEKLFEVLKDRWPITRPN